jgi:hypothetical protein
MRRILMLLIFLASMTGGLSLAQEQPPPFATNTPPPPEVIVSTPAAPINRFVLRGWRAADMLDVLYVRTRQLTPGAAEQQKALRLLQYEFARRFPNAVPSLTDQERLLMAMLSAPPGSVDARPVARPYVLARLNEHPDTQVFAAGGLSVELIAANIDGVTPQDAVLHLTAPSYNDFVPLVRGANGSYRMLTAAELPAAPLGAITTLTLQGIDDYNRDGRDELAVSLDDGQLNRQLFIFGERGGTLVSLTPPGTSIRFGDFVDWGDDGSFEVTMLREESVAWQCRGERPVQWRWNANFFRPTPDPEGYFFQSTANCLFYGLEPIFAQPIDEVLEDIDQVLAVTSGDTDYSIQRARVVQAMLHVLEGDIRTALALALELEDQAEPGSWLAEQTGALITALGATDVKPLEVCAALIEASTHGACDIDGVLTRIFAEFPLRRGLPIADQLAPLGITVQEQMRVSAVGKADRQVVRFELAGEHWWAFAPLDPEVYTAEKMEPLSSDGPAVMPLPVIAASESLYNNLLVNNDPAAVLTAIDNLVRANPQADIAPAVHYLQALSLDLLANRTRARQAYYDLWQQHPRSVWGQLAADHLEQR